jgi:phosphatidylglycerol:prolipoprotein diacylglycerol transferase
MEQLESGRILGLVTENGVVKKVASPSWAEKNGVQPNATFGGVQARLVGGPTPTEPFAHPQFDAVVNLDGKMRVVSSGDLPEKAIPVHPSQVYASIGGLILFLWTMSLGSLLSRAGYLFSLGLIAYGFVRILEELIRVDEGGQFGTSLSIATWISLAGILGGIVLLISVRSKSMPDKQGLMSGA